MAAKYGAIGSMVRSMTTLADDEPHTGNMNYDTTVSKIKIPSIALGYLSADALADAAPADAARRPSVPDVSPARRNAGRVIAVSLLVLLVVAAAWFVARRFMPGADTTTVTLPSR